jgi:hypothetical protein
MQKPARVDAIVIRGKPARDGTNPKVRAALPMRSLSVLRFASPVASRLAGSLQPPWSLRVVVHMTKRVTQAKSDPTMLILLAAIGVVGLLVARRYGVAYVLRTVNHALGIARVVRTTRPSAARPTRRRPARRVRPKVMGFSKPG